jgi:uncharacterized protein YndB with AHSA1/START domain
MSETAKSKNVHGTLEQTAEGWNLRFVRHLHHSPEKVWAAFTDPEQRAAWFPDTMIGEFVPGATLRFVTGTTSLSEFTGTVLAVDPGRLLEFTWGDDTLRFELDPTETGCTLTLRDSLSELGKAARDGAGWHVCLDGLAIALGDRPAGSEEDRWRAVHPDYVATFGPEAATIGPPADWAESQ